MPVSEAQKRARDKYDKEHYEYGAVKFKKGYKAKVQAAAARAGKSLNEYIIESINQRIEREDLSYGKHTD
jgi:predicted HicB family RNase H-like nuclease